jgi:hypothetical protein
MTEFEDPKTGKQYRISSLPGGLVQVASVTDGGVLFTAKHEDVAGEFNQFDDCEECARWDAWYSEAPT